MHKRPGSDEREKRRRDAETGTETDDDEGIERRESELTIERRRFVLHDLTTHYHPVPTYDLADRLSAFESTATKPEPFDVVHRQLVNDHLPRLEAAGLVETVGDRGRYVPTNEALARELTARDVERPPDE